MYEHDGCEELEREGVDVLGERPCDADGEIKRGIIGADGPDGLSPEALVSFLFFFPLSCNRSTDLKLLAK